MQHKKTEIKICCGTHCYIMGGAELQLLQEKLPPRLNAMVTIKGDQCLELCKDRKNGQPPFVTINQTIMASATSDKIIKHLNTIHNDLF